MSAILCHWYALCDHLAVGLVEHPILGAVPVCQRCVDKHDLDATYGDVQVADATEHGDATEGSKP